MADADTSASAPKSLLVVAGSGRSGTSLLAGLTGRLGFAIPQPELNANETNPRGFGEPRWAVAFHKDLLRSVAVTHDDGRPQAWTSTARVAERQAARNTLGDWLGEQFEQSDRVVVKDPRLAWFIDLYANVAKDLEIDLRIATMLRHPVETVRSKQLAYGGRSDGITRMAAWVNMMLHVEHETRALPRAWIRYDDLLKEWRATLAGAEQRLGVGLVSVATETQLAAADDLVDPDLKRSPADWSELAVPDALRELAEETFVALNSLAVQPDGSDGVPSTDRLDALREAYADYFHGAEAVVKSSLNAARAAERRRIQREIESEQQDQMKQGGQSGPGDGRTVAASPPVVSPGASSGIRRVRAGIRRRVSAIARRSRA